MKKTGESEPLNDTPETATELDGLRFILANRELGAEAVMHDFASRFSPLVSTTLLHQLHLYATQEVYRPLENKDDLDEFYEALNDLLAAVYSLSAKKKEEGVDRTAEGKGWAG